jgi:hypothetical protein
MRIAMVSEYPSILNNHVAKLMLLVNVDDRQLPPARPMMEAKPAIIPDYATSSTTSLLSPNSNDHLAFNGFQESLIDDIVNSLHLTTIPNIHADLPVF